jgi:hypothetical protein
MKTQEQELMENGLPIGVVLSINSKFKEYENIANEWNKKAYEIVVTEDSQVDLMQQAREGRLLLKAKRVEIEKTRKRLKEQSLLEGRFIDSLAKRLFAIIEPAEEHLELQEKHTEIKEQLRKSKLKAERLELLNPYLHFLDLTQFDLSTMSDVAFNTILNGAKVSLENFEKAQEKIRLEQEEKERINKVYSQRKIQLAPYSFFVKNEEDILYLDTTEEQFQEIFDRLVDRKKKDDEQKELLAKQNADLKNQVQKATEESKNFEAIAKSNMEYVKSMDVIKQEHTDMKIALETALNFIIPDQLRKIIENTLKSLK